MWTFSVPNISAWLLGVVGLAFTAAVVGALTDGFRRLPVWAWKLVHPGRRADEAWKQRVRDEKRERLRPRCEKAVDASEKLREATRLAEWGKTQASEELMTKADEVFATVRTQLLSEPESEPIVELYDQLHNGYLEYRVRLQEQEQLRQALRPDLPDFVAKVREQRDVVLGLAKELRKTVQRTLKSFEP